MSGDDDTPSIPVSAQPTQDDVTYDLDAALAAVVAVRTEIPADAFTAPVLGTERAGHGVVIDDSGLVVTIGYLITEAETIWLRTAHGSAVAAHLVGYDQTTGFGLVQALGRLGVPAMEIGSSDNSEVGDAMIVAGFGGRAQSIKTFLTAKREFAGYWEYVLDEALFTSPAHPYWGGAACIGADGRLQGIGSLFVQNSTDDGEVGQGNMIVPIDLLPPILDDLMRFGRVDRAPRPWLGMFTTDNDDDLVVAGLAEGGPAHEAGIQPGDVVLEVAGRSVGDLADMFRRIWDIGPAGTEIPLTISRDGAPRHIHIHSADRGDFLKGPKLH